MHHRKAPHLSRPRQLEMTCPRSQQSQERELVLTLRLTRRLTLWHFPPALVLVLYYLEIYDLSAYALVSDSCFLWLTSPLN